MNLIRNLTTMIFAAQNSEFHQDEFYPGQILTGKLSKFAGATWLEGGIEKIVSSSSHKCTTKLQVVAKVENVDVVSLGVQVRINNLLQSAQNTVKNLFGLLSVLVAVSVLVWKCIAECSRAAQVSRRRRRLEKVFNIYMKEIIFVHSI